MKSSELLSNTSSWKHLRKQPHSYSLSGIKYFIDNLRDFIPFKISKKSKTKLITDSYSVMDSGQTLKNRIKKFLIEPDM